VSDPSRTRARRTKNERSRHTITEDRLHANLDRCRPSSCLRCTSTECAVLSVAPTPLLRRRCYGAGNPPSCTTACRRPSVGDKAAADAAAAAVDDAAAAERSADGRSCADSPPAGSADEAPTTGAESRCEGRRHNDQQETTSPVFKCRINNTLNDLQPTSSCVFFTMSS
jgi:hypothetical protein